MSGNAPSPWAWSDEYRTIDGRATWSLVAADGYGILSCDGEENSPPGLNEPRLARLIAAAPILLSIAERWAALDGGSWHVQRNANEKAELLAETITAIAAVTGEKS